MPARSNQFQRLVFEIHRGLGDGWDVCESRPLIDSVTGEPREVDIVAEGKIHGYRIVMSVEVCDRHRVADVTWVEGLAKKHEHLPTTKLVLWSASGLSGPAAKKADALKIAVVTPVDHAPWATKAAQMQNSIVHLVLANLVSVVDVRMPDGTLARWNAPPEMLLTTPDGIRCCSIARIQKLTKEHETFGNVMLDNAPDGLGQFHAEFAPPEPCNVLGPDGTLGEVIRVLIDIKTQGKRNSIDVRSALHNNALVTLGEASMLDGLFSLVVRELQTGEAYTKATHTRPLD